MNMSDDKLTHSAPKSSFKFITTFMVAGVLLSVTLVSIYIPRTILWYFDPPTPMGVSCTPSIRWALDRLLTTQLISVGIGALLALLLGLKLRKKA